MKKHILAILLFFLYFSESKACSWYDPDYEYFNLFTQNIIRDKSYTPFLLTYSNAFYEDKKTILPNENIEAWQKHFANQLNYNETEYLVNHASINELQNLKDGKPISDPRLAKLNSAFYQKYKEGIDYLIEAKYLEPYMRISEFEGSDDNFYYEDEKNSKNAGNLNYQKTIATLLSLYNAAKNPEIKLRYGFQLVRFNHYSRKYQEAIASFQKYVAPLNLKSAAYYLALNQLAGAQRGLENYHEANWNFFQVFMHSKSQKQDAFVSMKMSDSASFDNLLKRAQNNDEKNMAYFLLGYQDFNNPLPMMEKMFELDPNSEMLKVLAARAINELERNYLPVYYYQNSTNENEISNSAEPITLKNEKPSLWQRIVNWIKSLFQSDTKETERSDDLSDKQYLKNPDRIPFYNKAEYGYYSDETKPQDYLNDLEQFVEKIQKESDDEFWQISDAYLKFLNKEYDGSTEILFRIKTTDPTYLDQIQRMKMLNDIVSQPKITEEFEKHLFTDYKDFFVKKPEPKKQDSINEEEEYGYDYEVPSTEDFLKDILANRYFLQGEDAKAFLMNNTLSDLRYNPNLDLAKKLQAFFNKKEKNQFEQQVIAKNLDDVGNTDAFFNVIYGDFAMRNADFAQAKKYYEKGNGFRGIQLPEGYYDQDYNYVKYTDTSGMYNGFENISALVFGHNVWESYQSPENTSMKAEPFANEFDFIKPKMNKLELANAALQLQNLGKSKEATAVKANQLIGNLLYNTSVLGYFRELFVMDIDNYNGGKYYFGSTESPFKFYYKNYISNVFIKPDNFDLAIGYYKKAFDQSTDSEQKSRILFQMASAEQGKYYQWEATQENEVSYDDPKWQEKEDAFDKQLNLTKNQKYRSYFALLKKDYANTQTTKTLMGSCSYFDYFMKR